MENEKKYLIGLLKLKARLEKDWVKFILEEVPTYEEALLLKWTLPNLKLKNYQEINKFLDRWIKSFELFPDKYNWN